MATTTTTTPNAPNLLTLVTDTESIVSSIDSLTSYLDSELALSTGRAGGTWRAAATCGR